VAGIGGDYRPSAVVAGNAAYNHWVKIESNTYSCLEGSLNSAGVASNVAARSILRSKLLLHHGRCLWQRDLHCAEVRQVRPVAVSSSDGSGGATLSNYQHWVKSQRHVFLL